MNHKTVHPTPARSETGPAHDHATCDVDRCDADLRAESFRISPDRPDLADRTDPADREGRDVWEDSDAHADREGDDLHQAIGWIDL